LINCFLISIRGDKWILKTISTIVIKPDLFGGEETWPQHCCFPLRRKTADGKVGSIKRDIRGELPFDIGREEIEEEFLVRVNGIHIMRG
jgi:hypothetical protein